MVNLDHFEREDLAVTRERVDSFFQMKYGVSLLDLDICDTPGYWQDKTAKHHPGHPLHSCLFCSGKFRATYTYHDSNRENGRWASRYRTWRIIKAAE